MFSGYDCMQRLYEGFDPRLLVCKIKRKAKYIDKQTKGSYFNPYWKKKDMLWQYWEQTWKFRPWVMPVRWNMSLPCPFSQNNTFYNTVSLKAFHALHHPRKFSLHWVTTNKHNVHQTNDKDLKRTNYLLCLTNH